MHSYRLHHLAVLILAELTAVTLARNCVFNDVQSQMKAMVRKHFGMTTHIPVKQEDIFNGCRTVNILKLATLDLSKDCFPAMARPIIMSALDSLFDKMCIPGHYQQVYLKNAKCFNDRWLGAISCISTAVSAVNSATVFKVLNMCCPAKNLLSCVHTWSKECSAKGSEFMIQTIKAIIPPLFKTLCKMSQCPVNTDEFLPADARNSPKSPLSSSIKRLSSSLFSRLGG